MSNKKVGDIALLVLIGTIILAGLFYDIGWHGLSTSATILAILALMIGLTSGAKS